ncbi:MAG: hypothetical protein J4F36_13780 [Nitrosopumilaceae archaeon]|nr:hypothetical protein [Nitrosopumilaceae archaeon]
MKELSENKIDQLIVNDSLKAAGLSSWNIIFGDSWLFTLTNGDDSSGTGNGGVAC